MGDYSINTAPDGSRQAVTNLSNLLRIEPKLLFQWVVLNFATERD